MPSRRSLIHKRMHDIFGSNSLWIRFLFIFFHSFFRLFSFLFFQRYHFASFLFYWKIESPVFRRGILFDALNLFESLEEPNKSRKIFTFFLHRCIFRVFQIFTEYTFDVFHLNVVNQQSDMIWPKPNSFSSVKMFAFKFFLLFEKWKKYDSKVLWAIFHTMETVMHTQKKYSMCHDQSAIGSFILLKKKNFHLIALLFSWMMSSCDKQI